MSINPVFSSDSSRRFTAFLELLRADAAAATRSYRLREIHRGRGLCGRALCQDCEQDVLMAVFDLTRRYENQKRQGKTSALTGILDAVIAQAEGTGDGPSPALLRSALANAGKDVRRRFNTALGRAAKPESTLTSGKDFEALREQPLLFEVALVVLRFANSSTNLSRVVMPHAKLTAQVNERLAAHHPEIPPVSEAEMHMLIPRALDATSALAPEWTEANLYGPLSERLPELSMPADVDVADADPWDTVVDSMIGE